jgi:hypothetical protein
MSTLETRVNASSELAAIPLLSADVQPIGVACMPATCWTVAAVAAGAFAAGYVYGEVVD